MKKIDLPNHIKEAVALIGKNGISSSQAAQILIQKYNLPIAEDIFVIGIENKLNSPLKQLCDEQGIELDNVNHYWYKGKHHSLHVKKPIPSYEEIKDSIIAEMREHAPVYPKIDRVQPTDGHLLVISPADIHIGKLAMSFETGDDYDEHIAVKRVRQGIRGCLDKSKSWNIDKILLIIGNDILHTDNPFRTTTAGTKQDTTGMWYSNFLIAKSLYIEIIELLLTVAPVHIQFNPSNHDWTNGFFLADTISSWFSKCPDLVMDVDLKHRKYFDYGQNLIGSTHGDGAKTADLPLLMAQEAPKEWGICKHRYIYTHHLHHKVSKDYGSVCIETLRSASGTDGWHSRNGYQHAPKSIECFIHSKDNGQVVRINNLF